MPTTILLGNKLSTVELNWNEVFYTNCGMVSASNVDQELGWCKTDSAAIGVDYSYFRSRRENDWWRITEHYGILNMLMLNDMTMADVEIVEFPYVDDWYADPKMLEPLGSATELYMGKMDHKRNLAFRPLEAALLEGRVDAIYTHSKTWQHLQEDTGKIAAIEDLSRHPDWRLQANNEPAVVTCSDVMAEQHPELVVTYLKAMIKVGCWANEHKRAAAAILDRQTYYRDAEDTYQGIEHIDMVPTLSPKNLAQIEIGKEFMLEHGYIRRDFDAHAWAAPEFLEQAAKELVEERWEKATAAKLPQAIVVRLG